MHNSHHRPENVHVAKASSAEAVNGSEVVNGDSVNGDDINGAVPKSAPKTLEEAISAAMLASKVYGKTSVESRMAWEVVEEMEASNRYEAIKRKTHRVCAI